MRAIRRSLRLWTGVHLRPFFVALREVILWGAFVAALERFEPLSPHDGADFLGLAFAATGALLFASVARRGWMPVTARAARWVSSRLKLVASIATPRHQVVLRPSGARRAFRADASLRAPAWILAAATAAVLAAGPHLQEGLLFLKRHVSYTLYLSLLAGIWSVLASVVVVGGTVAVGASGGASPFRLVVVLAAGAAAVGVAASWPGALPVSVLLSIATYQAWRLGRARPHPYLLCKRDASGRLHAVAVHEYVRRMHAVLLLFLAFAAVLGQAGRISLGGLPTGPLAFTQGLGIAASLAAILVVLRFGPELARIVPRPGEAPEEPLVPTLWSPVGTAPWASAAAERGWRVETSDAPPEDGFDLVVGGPTHPATFVPPDDVPEKDLLFRLERRFHVVKRREFFRRFQSLHKEVTSFPHTTGSGFLFGPHLWPIRGIIRDAHEEGSDAITASEVVGRPYAEVFPGRLRRYLGTIFGALRIDFVYWEDAVGWTPLRQVLGVALESYDQGRVPLNERDFVGVPRVRVVIQEEDAGDALEEEPGRDPDAARVPVPVHARILLVLRDRGGDVERIEPRAPSTGRRRPVMPV